MTTNYLDAGKVSKRTGIVMADFPGPGLIEAIININKADLEAPNTQILSGPPSATNLASVTFTFSSSEADSTFQCKVDDGSYSTCSSKSIFNVTGDGDHAVQVRAIDAAGNIDPTPASYTWTLDTVLPDTTLLTTPSNPTNGQSASFTFSSNEGEAAFACKIDAGAFTYCTSPATYADLAEGSHLFQVEAINAAGNIDLTPASYTWTIDLTPPDTTLLTMPANPTNSRSASFTFSSETGARFMCKLDGSGVMGGQFSECTSPHTYPWLDERQYTFQVEAIDLAGNIDPTPASYTWMLDLTPPEIILLTRPANPTTSRSASFTFSSPEPQAAFTCKIDGNAYAACTSPASYTLGYGVHTFSVRATDIAGNTSTPASYTWTIDTLQLGPVFTVSSTADTNDGACMYTHCTLLEAVQAANADSVASTIELDGVQEYRLNPDATSGDGMLWITSPITINGHGAIVRKWVISGDVNKNTRFATVNSGGMLTLKNIWFRDFNAPALSGGVIYNNGTVTIVSSTLSNNSGVNAGAIYNNATMTIVNSTFSANQATGMGGAITNAAGKSLTVINSTFLGNTSPDGGGIKNLGTATLKNSLLVKGNSGANCAGSLAAGSIANMADDSSCGTSAAQRTVAEISLSTTLTWANGGPTPTLALGSNSAAIERGNTTACQNSLLAYGAGWTDQRGYNRFADGPDTDTVAQCDIGAYEYNATVLNPNPGADTEPPLVFIDLTPYEPDGSNGWYRSPVSVAPSLIDDSDVIDLRCALDPELPPTSFDDLPETYCSFSDTPQVSTDGVHTVYAAAMDSYNNKSEIVSTSFQIDTTAPVLTCPAAGPFLLNSGDQPVGPAGVDASVSGLDEALSTLSGIVTTEAIGTQTLTFTAFDLAGNLSSQECSYNVIYDFSGFYPPVEAAPFLNPAVPGSAIPLKFSLAGDQGLDILAEGFPSMQQVSCDMLEPVGDPSETKPAGNSGLSYDPETGWYNYVWKTDKAKVGTCQALTIQLIDGTQHIAYFMFQ